MIKSNIGFFNNQGDVTKINDLIWPGFELIQDLIHVHLIGKFQDDPIKTEHVMLMESETEGFSAIKGT